MSLKTFHLFFIGASIVLALGFGAWEGYAYLQPEGAALDLALAVASAAGGVGLVFYFRAVVRKLKDISYL